MAMLITPDSEMGKEMARWEKPYRFEAYPKMLYMAQQRPDGRASVAEVDDRIFGGHPGSAEAFTSRCQRIVRSEDELIRARGEGWRDTQAEAMERHESKARSIADVAAARHYEDRNMSEKARAEAQAADDAAGMDHVPAVPVARLARKTGKAAARKQA